MAELTKDEKAWVRKVQRLLSNPPSDRLGFYTIGDPGVTIYDASKQAKIDAIYDANFGSSEFSCAVDEADAILGTLEFPNNVHSTAG